jgi:hypothetical protein
VKEAELRPNGVAAAIVVTGRYSFVVTWGVLVSPVLEVELRGREELTVDIHFDLGPQAHESVQLLGADPATVQRVAVALKALDDAGPDHNDR